MSFDVVEQPLLRARDEDEKNERRRAILKAADSLIDIRSRKLPTASQIAKAAGIAKGTPYLYFKTREEIYLALLGEWFDLSAQVVSGALNASNPSIENLLRRYTRFCAKNPKFVYLASMNPTILEENISVDMAHAFKKGLVDTFGPMCDAMATSEAHANLNKRLFVHMFSLTTGLWQHCHPPESVLEAYERGGAEFVAMDFESELYQALLILFEGALATFGEER